MTQVIISDAYITKGQSAWRALRNKAQDLCARHNAPDYLRAYVSDQLRAGAEKDPEAVGIDMLADSITELLTPMKA